MGGMDKVLCIGMNYRDHCEEQGAPVPTEPVVFNKFPSCVCGPTADLPLPACTQQLDWEVKLTVVIGQKASNVSKENAMSHVLGYTVAHDVSARDWQLKRLLVLNTFFRTEEHFVFSMKMKTKGLFYAEMAANGWLERP